MRQRQGKYLLIVLVLVVLVTLVWLYPQKSMDSLQYGLNSISQLQEAMDGSENSKKTAQFDSIETSAAKTGTQCDTACVAQHGHYDVVMNDDTIGQNANIPVDYYALALSWSPGFCDRQMAQNTELPHHLKHQCDAKSYAWVIHGLWPQSRHAKSKYEHPRYCQGDLPQLPIETLTPYLHNAPGAKLLQGAWEKHGSCAFHQAEDYFAQQEALFNQLVLPNKHQDFNNRELFSWLKKHNPLLKNKYIGGGRNEIYICYDKEWRYIDCPGKRRH